MLSESQCLGTERSRSTGFKDEQDENRAFIAYYQK